MGTKPVSAQRLEDLKKILGMKDLEEAQGGSEERQKEIEEKEERSKDGGSEAKKDELERLLKMIVVATSLSIAKGHEEEVTKEAKEERSYELWDLDDDGSLGNHVPAMVCGSSDPVLLEEREEEGKKRGGRRGAAEERKR